ncbi:MAG TPA: hypothetical protein VHG93_20850 [Longimicrobium sp.]|nr:hypothetical protein [Longimicrobium sp.]
MRRFIRSHPLLTAALGGAAIGLIAAVLLLRFGDAPGAGTFTRSSRIFAAASLPAGWWYHLVFGWAWKGSRASEFLAILPLNGAAWAVTLTEPRPCRGGMTPRKGSCAGHES